MAVLVVTENRIIFTEKDSCVVATGGGSRVKITGKNTNLKTQGLSYQLAQL